MNLSEILRFRSLRGMITAIILIVVGVSVALTAYVVGVASESMLDRTVEARTRLITNLAMQGIREAMLSGMPMRLRGTLERMKAVESINNVRIIDLNGMVRFDGARTDSGRFVSIAEYGPQSDSVTLQFNQHREGNRVLLEGLLPIKLESECRQCHTSGKPIIAYLNVESDMKLVKNQVSDFRAISIGAIILTLLGVGLALSVLLTHLVTKPLQRLETRVRASAEYVRTLTPDNELNLTGTVVPVEVEFEVGHLAESFNELLAALQRSHHEVKRLHNAEMERAGKMATIGELASSIAHEIRNPLAGILGAVEIIAEDLPADHPKRRVTDMMKAEIHRLNRTLSNLLSYARPRPLEFKRLRLQPIMEKTLEFVRERATRQHVEMKITVEAGVPDVVADEDGITQVLMNILLNALDAMPDGGSLAVRLSENTGRAVLQVRDSGAGMSPQAIASMFRPFFTTKAKGTGLGLAISKRIIDSHGGTFTVGSKAGVGTTVTIEIPASAVFDEVLTAA